MKMKALILILVLCLCAACFPIGATAVSSDWGSAYKDFILSGRYVDAFDYEAVTVEPWGYGEKRAMLLDMDADGTPELLISNGDSSQLGRTSYIFTYYDGQIIYIGNGPDYPTYYPGTSIPGIAAEYAPDGGAGTHTLGYRWKEGNAIQREAVYSCDRDGDNVQQITDNDELFRVCLAGGKTLEGIAITGLDSTGWANFVNGAFPGTIPDDPPARPSFTDIPANAFYAAPVAWAVESGITSGTSSAAFSPNAACTRGQIVTFLWRAAGEPEPSSGSTLFVDVKPTDYSYKAVLWAVENGITSGTDTTHFSPDAVCTRGQAVTFMWRAAGEPANTLAYNPFKDVKAGNYFYDAVLWAVDNGITAGTSGRLFSPEERCNRGQIVTFLYRHYVEPAEVVMPMPETEIYKNITNKLTGKVETSLYDIDGDGTDEMFVYYGESSGDNIKFSMYTIKNDAAVPVIENEVLQWLVSSPSGGVGVVEKNGRQYVYTCGRNSGYTHPNTRYTGTLRLYSFNGTKLTLADEVDYILRVEGSSTTPFEATIGRKTDNHNTIIGYSEYKAWVDSLRWKMSLGDTKGTVNAYF